MERINFTTPVGRLVAGSLYKGADKDAEGRPLVVKNGPDAGKPRLDFYHAIAIEKAGEKHWAETAWGRIIWDAGHKFLAHAGQMPAFAWKITDGDSQVPNKRGKRPCDREGYPKHWVLGFSSGFPSQLFTVAGLQSPVPLHGENAINLGDFVQVNGSVTGNGSTSQPGVYLNHNMTCLIGYGQRIVVGPDVESAGFGGALPAGASLTPPAGFVPPQHGASTPQPAPVAAAPQFTAPPTPTPAQSTAPVSSAPPYTGFMQPPGAPTAPPAGPVMTAKAGGATYQSFRDAGWTDEQMRQQGYLA